MAVATNSPLRSKRSAPCPSRRRSATDLSGCPAKRSANTVLHPPCTSKPQLDGCSGATATPRAASSGTQAPSEPRRDQLPPPSASTTARARTRISCAPCANTSRPASSQPLQRWRMCICTGQPGAGWRRRYSQARSKGAAFISVGKTRPEEPTKVSMPKSCAQRRAPGPSNWASDAAKGSWAAPKRRAKISGGSLCVRFRPPRPASKNLRPTEGMASNRCTLCPALESTCAAISPAGPPPTMATSHCKISMGAFLLWGVVVRSGRRQCEQLACRAQKCSLHSLARVG